MKVTFDQKMNEYNVLLSRTHNFTIGLKIGRVSFFILKLIKSVQLYTIRLKRRLFKYEDPPWGFGVLGFWGFGGGDIS